MRYIDIKDPKHAKYLMDVYGIPPKITVWMVDGDECSEDYMLLFSQIFEKKGKGYCISSRNEYVINIGDDCSDDTVIEIAKSYAIKTFFDAQLYRQYSKENYEKL